MNLFLHWLRWDLRRFRWLLLAWVSMLTLLMGWLWYVNSHLLTLSHLFISNNQGPTGTVLFAQVFFLMILLNSDPAAGVNHFWKTRPPSGLAVAGAKLIMVLVFFLALPLAEWWLVRAACESQLEPFRNLKLVNESITLMEFIWWIQCLAVSTLVLCAIAARNAGNAVARILTGSVVLLVAAYLIVCIGGERETPMADWVRRAVKAVMEGAATSIAAGMWFTVTAMVFLAARRTRTPARVLHWSHWVLPMALLAGGAWLPQPASEAKPERAA